MNKWNLLSEKDKGQKIVSILFKRVNLFSFENYVSPEYDLFSFENYVLFSFENYVSPEYDAPVSKSDRDEEINRAFWVSRGDFSEGGYYVPEKFMLEMLCLLTPDYGGEV
jgi:hypothetical protein